MKRRSKFIIFFVVISVVIAGVIISRKSEPANLQSEILSKTNLSRTVLATGTVTSTVDLNLSFKASGVVKDVMARVGKKVKFGDVLVRLDARDQIASLTQARGSLAQAQANYKKVLDGISNEEIAVAQVAVDNARKSLQDTIAQQDVLVNSYYKTLLNTTLSAIPSSQFSGAGVSIALTGVYSYKTEAVYLLKFYDSGGGLQYTVSGPGGQSGQFILNIPLKLNDSGLYFTAIGVSPVPNDSWTINIPNTQSASYVANLNAYNTSLQTRISAISAAQSILDSAQATLNLKKAQIRPADIEAAKAQVLSAQGQLESSNAQYENTIIRAPSGGTVTDVGIKIGEQATALKPVISLQDVDNLYVEANVSEANIALISVGQKVTYTFDALGTGKEFTGQVTAIDPASTVVSGVVNYKVTSSIDGSIVGTTILPGMTANISVKVAEKSNALAVPQRAILEKEGKSFVRVVTNKDQGTFEEKEITTGLEADGGLVEVTSGLKTGDEIITFLEEKK